MSNYLVKIIVNHCVPTGTPAGPALINSKYIAIPTESIRNPDKNNANNSPILLFK